MRRTDLTLPPARRSVKNTGAGWRLPRGQELSGWWSQSTTRAQGPSQFANEKAAGARGSDTTPGLSALRAPARYVCSLLRLDLQLPLQLRQDLVRPVVGALVPRLGVPAVLQVGADLVDQAQQPVDVVEQQHCALARHRQGHAVPDVPVDLALFDEDVLSVAHAASSFSSSASTSGPSLALVKLPRSSMPVAVRPRM